MSYFTCKKSSKKNRSGNATSENCFSNMIILIICNQKNSFNYLQSELFKMFAIKIHWTWEDFNTLEDPGRYSVFMAWVTQMLQYPNRHYVEYALTDLHFCVHF